MKYEAIFRDSKNWYKSRSNYASERLIDFAVSHADDTILDAGCATGDYMQRVGKQGYHCTGMDINSKYVNIAKQKGLDTILLFEVLEHVDKPEDVPKEVRRVARKNVLITVPNCTQFHRLRKVRLTDDHMREKDHVNFFTKSDMESLLSQQFLQYHVHEGEPTFLGDIGLPRSVRYPLPLLYKLRLISPDFYFRLYAVARVIRMFFIQVLFGCPSAQPTWPRVLVNCRSLDSIS